MPFTFAHPAIILPLKFLNEKWFSFTGLVIGTLTPDFEYFLRMRMQSNYSHTIYGLFWFDLPLGILISFIFHNIVRDSLFINLPASLKSRLMKFNQFDWNNFFIKNWYVVVISVLTGSISHLFWDSFTHNHGYFVEIIPVLKNTIDIFGRQILVFKILQHSSTILGGIIIALALLKLPADKNITGKLNLKYWSVLSLFVLIIIAFRILSGLNFKEIGHLVATCISAVLISLILTPLFTRLKK